MNKQITFDEFRDMILYHRVVEWNQLKNYIVLDNGIRITIQMTDSDCCAYASGVFEDVKLDAAITDVTEPKYTAWDDGYTYGCSAVVKMLHNQNLVCKVNADADAGNGGYYYSIASFIVTIPIVEETLEVYLVGSDDQGEGEVDARS